MAIFIWVKTTITVSEARPAGENSSEQLEIGGKKFAFKYGIVDDPNEVSVDYYVGWRDDPQNGYDYYVRSIAGVSFERPEQEFFEIHGRKIPLWQIVSVPDDFAVPSDIPILRPGGGDTPTVPTNPVPEEPDIEYGVPLVISAGSTTFNWSNAAFETGRSLFQGAIDTGIKTALTELLTPLVGGPFTNSVMNTVEVGQSTISFATEATDVLSASLRDFNRTDGAGFYELSNRLFIDGYAQHATTLNSVLSRNGAPGTDYFEQIYGATAITARNINASSGDYEIFSSGEYYYPSDGDDLIVLPGRVQGVTAGTGNDVVMIGTGDSSVKDEAGSDIYVAHGTGNSATFGDSWLFVTISKQDETITVSRYTGENDQLVGFEKLHFNEGTVAFNEISAQGYRIYQAAFDRTPDLGGLGHWIRHLEERPQDLVWVAQQFIGSREFQDTYGTPDTVSNRDFVTLLYANVLDRTPDEGGFAAWNTNMQNGMSRQEVLAHFSESAENKQNVESAISDGIWYF